MQSVLQALRTMGIVVGLAFVGLTLWVAVIGPAILIMLKPQN